jgi:hypothetical protein
MNVELRIALIRKYGSQIRAAKPLQIDEARLSRLVNGHRDPTAEERQRFTAVLGCDYFASDGERSRAGET